MYQKLEEINRNLIQLLAERLAILTELNTTEANCPNPYKDLTQASASAHLSRLLWQNFCYCDETAFPVTQTLATATQSRIVTIIGGKGAMGRWFGQRLCHAGHQVRILDQDNWNEAKKLVEGCDLVLISVPIDCTILVIERIAPFLSPHTPLADLTSLKSNIVAAMLTTHTGPVMGLHPMFGPSVPSFADQNIVMCPGRQTEAFDWFLTLIETTGGNLIKTTPEDHDQMMIFIQAIRQFSTLTLGHFLKQESFDINLSHRFSTPSFRQELDTINRLFAQSPSLIIDIMSATPERREAIARLAQTYNRLAQLVEEQQRDRLIAEFRETSAFLQRYLNPDENLKQLSVNS